MAINKIAVVGAGYMGGGIAQVFAIAGHQVVLADADAELTKKNLERLIAEAKDWEERGLFLPGNAVLVERNLSAAESIEDAVADADYIQEAVPEKPQIKDAVLSRIEAAARPDAIIASNTSTLPIGGLAKSLKKADRFLGVHFSNPSPFIPGVEVILHKGTDESLLPEIEELVRSTGKLTARVNDSPGFVLNRLQYALLKEAISIVDDGVAAADDVDIITRTTFGFRLPFFGPFAIADMAGLDVYRDCFKTFEDNFGERFATPEGLKNLVDEGHLGTKAGGGFVIPAGDTTDLVAYRNTAYAKLQQLLTELGQAPGVK
ncbi:3-hydroxyacyl-CoA dehydrogenase family protein [Propionimicrobium sp. PCR01-08-3]|uniref:3-hydroxyacyl-CoA dehydrogenase family protein n=1 Tax=Propionimicrobium sp. PCR01-08-3 TaxID=3052086 RepID=UPI00255C4EB4|nr:3-hydroxyacyl-CoA dehydrogenase family protein [Propionimicrobium sp. PCR01-08-3]WIY83757.1 3-hydroxyacyl-CoA dehydrogenase family protein [Propionimicrobium sp. PCR01-08-3]